MSKAASRLMIAGGGSVIAGVTYYGNRFKEWGDEQIDNFADFIKSIRVPDMDFGIGNVFSDVLNKEFPKKAHNSSTYGTTTTSTTHSNIFVNENQFMLLTKRLIEVRNILKTVDKSDSMILPSIVVIGSQSSGKSSLLESIIGHEILPKGNNMVTKRPVEITLISTPMKSVEYAEFPLQGLRITDFDRIKTIIKELNDSVTEEECVSDVPIDLRIYSPHVPDLTLIDLPGYIAINTKNQPEALKQKIQKVCRKYIQDPNIILAVCAADVDLANSEALNESRAVDPFGERTVGVLTKIDLVEPERVKELLQNDKYPLHLGYFGVICKDVGEHSGSEKYQLIQNRENQYFREHSDIFAPVAERLGIGTLRTSLMKILENRLSKSLKKVVGAVRKELDETRYQFKVEFNDQHISPETYTTQLLALIKSEFKKISQQYSRPELRDRLQKLLDKQVVEVCDTLLWEDKVDLLKLKQAQNQLTKSGLGRTTTQYVIDLLKESLKEITSKDAINVHKDASKMMLELADEMLKAKMYNASDQVENAMKPFKYDIEFTDQEWETAREHCFNILRKEYDRNSRDFEDLKNAVGWRKLRTVMQYLETKESQEKGQFSDKLLGKARKALEVKKRMENIRLRLNHLKPFSFWTNWYPACTAASVRAKGEDCLCECAEPYLFLVAEKLAQTAVMFLWIELLNDFIYQYPLEIDNRLYYKVERGKLEAFAKENKTVERHLKLLERKLALETAMEKLMSVQNLT